MLARNCSFVSQSCTGLFAAGVVPLLLARNFSAYKAKKLILNPLKKGRRETDERPIPDDIYAKKAPEHFKKPNLFELINMLPSSSLNMKDPQDKNDPLFANKNGRGMKFFLDHWKYSRPCYWHVSRYVPRKIWTTLTGPDQVPIRKTIRPQLHGVKTWEGQTASYIAKIPHCSKRGWRFIAEPHLPIIQYLEAHPEQYKAIQEIMIQPDREVNGDNYVDPADEGSDDEDGEDVEGEIAPEGEEAEAK